jgi:Fe-S-cluster-containing dehydrogenase component
MTSHRDTDDPAFDPARRRFLGAAAGAAGAGVAGPAWGGNSFLDAMGSFFQDQYQRMTDEEIADALGRIERRAMRQYGVEITCKDTKPQPGVVFGYALNISKCQGYRDCVYACIRENNQGRDSQMQYIRVLEMDQGTQNLEHSEHYYDPATVPVDGKYYMPVQCMQCDNPPCVKACPVEATWKDPDGIVVIDYDWCIGCRYCMTACPYWARHFNWNDPGDSAGRDQPEHQLPRQPAAAGKRRGGEVPLLHPAHPRGAAAGLPGGLPDRGAHLRQPSRSEQRDSLRAGRTSRCSGSRKNSVRNRSSGTSRTRWRGRTRWPYVPAVSSATACAPCSPAIAPTFMWLGFLGLLIGVRGDRLPDPGPPGPGGHRHERPGVLGLLHLQLRVSGRHRGGGGAAGDPRLHFPPR